MSEIEKARAQRDARRTATSRRASSSADPSQAIIRHLSVQLYKESHHTEQPPSDHDSTKDEHTNGSHDQ